MTLRSLVATGGITGLLAILAEGQVSLRQGLKDLAETLISGNIRAQTIRVGVLPFRELDGRETVLGAFLAEELTTHLAAHRGLQIVERTVLDKLLGEMKLGKSGIIDVGTAKSIGKIIGVDSIISGTVTDLETSIAVNCRLIDVESGKVLSAAQARINKDADVARLMRMSAASVGGTPHSSRNTSGTILRPGVLVEGDVGVQRQTGHWLITIDNIATTDRAKTIVGNLSSAVASDQHVLVCFRFDFQSATSNPRALDNDQRRLQKTNLLLVEIATGRRFDPLFFRDAVLSRVKPGWAIFNLPETVNRDLVLRVRGGPAETPAEFKLRIK